MKKTFCFILCPILVLIFAILNAILLFPNISKYTYKGKINGNEIQINIVEDVYFVRITKLDSLTIEDFGFYTENGQFISEKNQTENILIQKNNSFCITYDKVKLYSIPSIFLEVFYDIIIVVGIFFIIYGLVFYKKKDGE